MKAKRVFPVRSSNVPRGSGNLSMSRRQFVVGGAASAALAGGAAHRAPPRARGRGRAEQQAAHCRRGLRRHGADLSRCLRGREHRGPLRSRSRLCRQAGRLRQVSQGVAVSRLPRDVRQGGQEFRRSDLGHSGPHARRHPDGRAGPEEAHLLCQAGHAHHRRGPPHPRGRAGLQGDRHQDQRPVLRQRGGPQHDGDLDGGRPGTDSRGPHLVQPSHLPLLARAAGRGRPRRLG